MIDVPSKWDIIPIHASDVGAFLRCRRYWAWSSPSRLNLRRRVDINGVNMPLWFGTGIHYALEMYYNPSIKRDPVEAFTTWYEYQWNGGIVTEEWLERTFDLNPVQEDEQLYRIRGLKELLPDPIQEEFEEHRELGIGMMEFYRDYAAEHDDFTVIAAESTFSVPLGFSAIDIREDSPNYGKLLEVHARGKRDTIILKHDTGKFGIIDHKTAANAEEEYFVKLENDPQVSTYMWASQQEAIMHDLPYKRIDDVLYNVLHKRYPKPPTILKDGISPSINRQTESATAEMFASYIKEQGLEQLYEADPKWQAYYNWLVEIGESRFVERASVLRNPHQLEAHGEHLRMIAKEMLNPDVAIYPTPNSSWWCTRCQFRAPCLAADDGSDYVHMLADGYEENVGR